MILAIEIALGLFIYLVTTGILLGIGVLLSGLLRRFIPLSVWSVFCESLLFGFLATPCVWFTSDTIPILPLPVSLIWGSSAGEHLLGGNVAVVCTFILVTALSFLILILRSKSKIIGLGKN